MLCIIITGLAACNTPASESPSATIDGMFTAMKNGNIEDMKKFITKNDVNMLESAEKLMMSVNPEGLQKMKDKNLEQNLDKWILSSEEINFIKINNTEIEELNVLSLHLLQSYLVYINTLMIQYILKLPHWQNILTTKDKRAISLLIHFLNLYSIFLDMNKRLAI